VFLKSFQIDERWRFDDYSYFMQRSQLIYLNPLDA